MALINLGDSLSLILLPLLVIQRFGFGPELGVTLAARLVPVVLGGGVAMWVLSRFPARIVSSLAIAGLASMTALLPVTNDLVQLNAVSMMAGIASSMAGPALLSMRSSVVPRGQVVRANSLVVAAERLPQVIGPLAAAVALTVVDVGTLFVVKAALTLLAAALVIGLRAPAPAAPVKLLSAENLRAWRELLRNRRLAGYLVTGAAYAIAAGVARMVLIAISATSFPDAPYMLALLLGALAVGSVVGALLGSLVPVRWSGRLYVIGTVGEAGAVMSAASSDHVILLVGLLVVAGSLEALATIAFFSDVQVLLDERQNGVLFAGFLPIADAGAILGTLTGPVVIAAGGVLLGAGLAAALAVAPLLPFLGWFLRASRSP